MATSSPQRGTRAQRQIDNEARSRGGQERCERVSRHEEAIAETGARMKHPSQERLPGPRSIGPIKVSPSELTAFVCIPPPLTVSFLFHPFFLFLATGSRGNDKRRFFFIKTPTRFFLAEGALSLSSGATAYLTSAKKLSPRLCSARAFNTVSFLARCLYLRVRQSGCVYIGIGLTRERQRAGNGTNPGRFLRGSAVRTRVFCDPEPVKGRKKKMARSKWGRATKCDFIGYSDGKKERANKGRSEQIASQRNWLKERRQTARTLTCLRTTGGRVGSSFWIRKFPFENFHQFTGKENRVASREASCTF